LTALALYQEIDAKSPRGDGVQARRAILDEWAGAPPPASPAARPPIERMWRLLVGAQDELVRRLETVMGGDEARRIARALLDVRVSGTEDGCPTGARAAGR
jgi:hypothetical protein